MKKIFLFLFTASIAFLLTACANDEEVADELIDYYNTEWIPVQVMKQENMNEAEDKLIDITTNDDGTSDQEEEITALVNEDMVAVMDDILDQFEAIHPEQKAVTKMNNLQIEAEKLAQQHAASTIDNYKGDLSDSKYSIEGDKLKEKYDDVLTYRDELMEKYGLEFDKEKGQGDGFYEIKRKDG